MSDPEWWNLVRATIPFSSKTFNYYRIIGNHQMYEVLDDTAAQTIPAIESGDSIRRVVQHLHTPYETVRQAVNWLEDAGYVSHDDGLTVVDDHVRDAACDLVAASAGVSPPSIEETYVIPQFGDWPFASRTSTPGRHSSSPSTFPPHSIDSPETSWTDRCRSSSSHTPHSKSNTSRGTQ